MFTDYMCSAEIEYLFRFAYCIMEQFVPSIVP